MHPWRRAESLQHIFHQACAEPWLLHHSTCPMCRQSIVPLSRMKQGESIEKAFERALEENNQDFAFELLATTSISDKCRYPMFFATVRRGHEVMMKLFLREGLPDGTLGGWVRGRGVLLAAERGHVSIVHELLESGFIDVHNRSVALVYAATKGFYATVRALLKHGPTFTSDLEKAFMVAVENQDFITFSELFNSRKKYISDECQGRAFCMAATRGHEAIVNAILSQGRISMDSRIEAFLNATHAGHKIVANTIEGSSPFFIEQFQQKVEPQTFCARLMQKFRSKS